MQHQKWAAISAAFAVATALHAQVTFYVDDDAPAGGDGLSWYSAFNDLQDALDASRAAQSGASIHLAQGLYTPDRGTGDRHSTFDLALPGDESTSSGFALSISGGFAGLGHPDPDTWHPSFASVLSGDLLNNDSDADGNTRSDNAIHVAVIGDVYRNHTYLSDLTIRGGLAIPDNPDDDAGSPFYGRGGGLCIGQAAYPARVLLQGVHFVDCGALLEGGALYVGGLDVQVWNSRFENNRASSGGSLFVGFQGEAEVQSALFVDSFAVEGGAVAVSDDGIAFIYGSRFFQNEAALQGGAVSSTGRLTMHACVLAGNRADSGGAVATQGAADLFTCTFTDNSALHGGGLLVGPDSVASIVGSILWGNIASESSPQIWFGAGSNVTVVESCVQPDPGPPPMNDVWWDSVIFADPKFVDPDGPDGDSNAWLDNDYTLQADSPCIDAAPYLGPEYHWSIWGYRPVSANCSCKTVPDMGAFEFAPADCPAPASRVHVDAAAPSGGNGLTWQTAFNDLDLALNVSGVTEIWVAEGVYFTPRSGAGFEVSCFYEAQVLGGFAGWESDATERDPIAHETIISGDRLGNDGLPGTRTDNDRRALVSHSGEVTLDGFIFHGFGDSDTADFFAPHGILRFDATRVALRNCRFEDNVAWTIVDAGHTDVEMVTCAWYGNHGLIFDSVGDLLVLDCTFIGNSTSRSDQMLSPQAGHVRDSIFASNHTAHGLLQLSGESTVVNCVFVGNTISRNSSMISLAPSGLVSNCVFASNDCAQISWTPYGTRFQNSWLWNNTGFVTTPINHDVRYCLADFPLQGEGNVLQPDPQTVRLPSAGPDTQWGTPDDDIGDLRPRAFSPLIDAGDSSDVADLTGLDLAGNGRFVDDVSVADTGLGYPTVDIGPYERQINSCLPDWDDDGSLTFNDALTYLAGYDAQDPRTDLNSDGQFGFYDVQMFLNAFAAGCP